MPIKVVGYGICGKGEAKRYMRATMEEFKRLCDETIILCNNVGQEELDLIRSYGFKTAQDDREWGLNQQHIKQDFITRHVAKLKPDWLIALDMDEVFEPKFDRKALEALTEDGWAFHFYVVNLWNEGHKPRRNFWNVRMWKWNGDTEFLNRPLHPGIAPKWCYLINQYAPFILRHYGLKEKADRMKKVERYEKYDPNAKFCSREYYEDLKTDDFQPYDEEAVHRQVESEVKKYKPKVKREPIKLMKKDFSIIKRTNLVTGEDFSFDVATRDVSKYLSQSSSTLRFELVGKLEDVTDEIEELFKEEETKIDLEGSNFDMAEEGEVIKPKRTFKPRVKKTN